MIDKLKQLYNNDVNYDKVLLYFKNCTEKEDWYYKQLIQIYEDSEQLEIDTQTVECHGNHNITQYTDESSRKINDFITKLNILLNDNHNFEYNSHYIIN